MQREPGLRERALRLLARREHSRAELARKLGAHCGPEDDLDALLDDLSRRKLLSDERYAEARARQLARKYGAARIRHDLKAKGVDAALVARVSGEGELERARDILARKYRAPATTPRERARRMRFLQSRGYSRATIRALLSSGGDDDALNPERAENAVRAERG